MPVSALACLPFQARVIVLVFTECQALSEEEHKLSPETEEIAKMAEVHMAWPQWNSHGSNTTWHLVQLTDLTPKKSSAGSSLSSPSSFCEINTHNLILNSIRKVGRGKTGGNDLWVWPLAITRKYIVIVLSKVIQFLKGSEHEIYWEVCFTEISICQQTQTFLKLKEGQNCGRNSSVPLPAFFYSNQDFNPMVFELSLLIFELFVYGDQKLLYCTQTEKPQIWV